MDNPQLQFQQPLVAGTSSDYTLSGTQGYGHVEIQMSVEGQTLGTWGCDDPPCYEAVVVPEDSAGSIVDIVVSGEGVYLELHELISPQHEE